jgi:hypothetical protein
MIWSPARYNSSRPLGDHAGDNPPLLEIFADAAGLPVGGTPDIHLEVPPTHSTLRKEPAARENDVHVDSLLV